MDAADYNTNTLLINDVFAISYRIYEPVASPSSPYTFAAPDVEDDLRKAGHLVHMDTARRGIWCFFLSRKMAQPGSSDESGSERDNGTTTAAEQFGLSKSMEVCGYMIEQVEEGSLESASLPKKTFSGSIPIRTPNSAYSTASGFDHNMRNAQAPSFGDHNAMLVDAKETVPGMISDPKGYRVVPAREVHEFFITAVLSSMSASFCRQTGAVPLDQRTVLLPPDLIQAEDSPDSALNPPIVVSFRVYLTTAGTLVMTTRVSNLEGITSLSENSQSPRPPTGTVILAAPIGAFGLFQATPEDDGTTRSQEYPFNRSYTDAADRLFQWKNMCSKLLLMRGASPSLLDGCSWLNVQTFKRESFRREDGSSIPILVAGPTAPWPAILCFRKQKSDVGRDSRCAGSLPASPASLTDALTAARSWYQTSLERETILVKRKHDREVAQARRGAEGEGGVVDSGGCPSLALRHPSNGETAAGSGTMYPTPPDGIQPSGVDAILSSPGYPAPIVSTTAPDADTTARIDAVMADIYAQSWDGSECKGESHTASFAGGENLFGDLGDDLFDENELTDADFNFFDEKPNESRLDLPASPDLNLVPEPCTHIDQTSAESSEQVDARPGAMEAVVPSLPEFTKPELRHARSSLARLSHAVLSCRQMGMGIKREPSPFTQESVYKRVRVSLREASLGEASLRDSSSLSCTSKQAPARREGVFEHVDLDPCLSLANRKYEERGPFRCELTVYDREQRTQVNRYTCPSVSSLLTVRGKENKSVPAGLGELIARINQVSAGKTWRQRSSCRHDESHDGSRDGSRDSDESSEESDDSMGTGEEVISPAKSMIRRHVDDDVVSVAASAGDVDVGGEALYMSIDPTMLSKPGGAERSITKYFADTEPEPLPFELSDDDYMTVAQMVTEQAASASLTLGPQGPESRGRDARRRQMKALRHAVRCLQIALPHTLAGANKCQLRPFADAADIPSTVTTNTVSTRPRLWMIPQPHVEFMRYDTKLSVLPTAVTFWESLGLSPSRGPKNIAPVCVFPDGDGVRDSAAAFLKRVKSVYESLKLGSWEAHAPSNGMTAGLVPLRNRQVAAAAGSVTTSTRSGVHDDVMAMLSQVLAESTMTGKNFVVFFLYDADVAGEMVQTCVAFQALTERYKRAMKERRQAITNEVVLQLVPLHHVASESSLVVLSPDEYMRLSIETYDRCSLLAGPMPAPSILLEEALPKGLDLKVTTRPSQDVVHENSYMHVSYAQSVDERWITAAWTDNRGSMQMTASYCLGRRNACISRPFSEVAREIWETTLDMVSVLKVHWRVVVTRCGPMDDEEMESWISIPMPARDAKPTVSLTVLTVDSNPCLQLMPAMVRIPLTTSSMFYTTPVSTPQPPSAVSPDQNGNPATAIAGTGGSVTATTPGDGNMPEPDVETTLIDVAETTWGVSVAHRLNNSISLTDLKPALVSGYLVKRTGPRMDDPPVLLELNMLHCDRSPNLYDHVLRDLLGHFRGLGTLARVRGLTDREFDIRPWHVAAAEKGVRALYHLM